MGSKSGIQGIVPEQTLFITPTVSDNPNRLEIWFIGYWGHHESRKNDDILLWGGLILILSIFDYDSGTGSCISWLMALNRNDKVPVWSSPDTIAAPFPFSIWHFVTFRDILTLRFDIVMIYTLILPMRFTPWPTPNLTRESQVRKTSPKRTNISTPRWKVAKLFK